MDDWADRATDFRRHVVDLQVRGFEGALDREEKDRVFRASFDLLQADATDVLAQVNRLLLDGTGTLHSEPPHDDGDGGLTAAWVLSWPLQAAARNRFTGKPLDPIRIGAVFPADWTHPHLAARPHLGTAGLVAWPMQVADEADVPRQRGVLRAIAEAELHDRIYEADVNWRIIPGHDEH